MIFRRVVSKLCAVPFLATLAFAQSASFTTVSAGNWGPIVAPDSIAAGFGTNVTNQTYAALSQPLPFSLGGVSLKVADSGNASQATPLFFTSTSQVNFLVPANASLGKGIATLTANGGGTASGIVLVSNVAPAVFAANGNGQGVAAAKILRVNPATGQTSLDDTFVGGSASYGTKPISLAASEQVYLLIFGTGIRRHTLNPVIVTIGGVKVPVTYAGPVSGFAGLDQVNIGPLPSSLSGTGKGDVGVVVTVDGVPANTVNINIL